MKAMFREMVRIKQQLTQEETLELLKAQPRGVLSLLGDNGYPYGLPIDHWYNEEDGWIYFHSGREGHKVDAIRGCSKASFCVYDEGCKTPEDWALNIKSVIVFGRIHIIGDQEKALELIRRLSRKYTQDEAYIQQEIDCYGDGLLVFALEPKHMTGKITKES